MSSLIGTVALTRYALRRDRLLIPVWLVVLVGVVYVSAAATPGLYPTEAERVATAQGWNATPAVVALYGPLMDPTSLGELSMTKMTVLYAVLVAVMSMVVVRRHLRTEEESGRAEFVGATGVGRGAPLGAAMSEIVLIAAALLLLCAAAGAAGGLPLQGSLLFGAAWAGILVVFGAATALACQLSASSRTCAMIASALIGGAYVTRVVGDLSNSWVSWLTPFGWNSRLRAWSDEPRWWVLGLYVALAAALLAAAALMTRRRDHGSGLLAPRPGPASGDARLGGAGALAWRAGRGPFRAWAASVVVMGILFGWLTPGITDLLNTPAAMEMVEKLGGAGALEDVMVSAILGVVAVVITCFAITLLVHAAEDEHDGRTEMVLATGVTRRRQFMAHGGVALVGSTVLVALSGLSMGVGTVLASGESDRLWRVTAAGLAQAPAVWVVLGCALLALGVGSRWTWVGWVLVTLFLLLGEFGELLRLPRWLRDLSPYAHTPRVPAEAWQWAPLGWLTLVAFALGVVAWFAYRRRNIG